MASGKLVRAPAGSICERIRIARNLVGMTRAELGRYVGVKPSAARQWEGRGGTTPRINHLAGIASITGTAFEWLATGRGPATLSNSEQQPVLVAEVFARDSQEERVLLAFRRINSRYREPIVQFIEGLRQ